MSYGYVPAPAPPPPVARESWFARNWKWFLPTVILAPILLIVLLVAVVGGAVFGMMKSSEPYQHAVALATSDQRVVNRLGAPITPGWFVSGSINVSDSTGEARLLIPLNGRLRQGAVQVIAKKSDGVWSYQTLEVRVPEEPTINLLPASSPPPDEEK